MQFRCQWNESPQLLETPGQYLAGVTDCLHLSVTRILFVEYRAAPFAFSTLAFLLASIGVKIALLDDSAGFVDRNELVSGDIFELLTRSARPFNGKDRDNPVTSQPERKR